MIMKNLQGNNELHIINMGIIFLLLGLSVGLLTYLLGISLIYYISFSIVISSIFFMFSAMSIDLNKFMLSPIISFSLIAILILLYFSQRTVPLEFSFMIGDASDYFWSGVSSSLHGNDIGFFPPLTSSVSAIGYQIFGLKYIPMMTVLIYFSSMPLFYFLFRKFDMNPILSYVFVLLFQFVPLNIWLSKTTFSEPVWQVLILIFISYIYIISNKKTLTWIDLLPLFIMMLLAPLSRGSAVILYGGIAFLSFYHYWRYTNFKLAVILLLSMIILAISIHYSLNIRTRYLIEWQYRRILPGITVSSLMIIFYSIPFLSIGLLVIVRWYKTKYQQLNLPLLLVVFSILFKITIALYFSIKKQADFSNHLYLNEFGLAEGNFGFIIAVVIFIGLFYMHYKAAKGDGLLLTFVIVYALFSIPFAMQDVSFENPHELLLYWNRYYFSEFFIIHFFALAILFKLLYNLLGKIALNETYRLLLLIPILLGVFFYSMDMKLHNIVSREGYLTNSSKIFTWVSERANGKKLSIVYSSKIRYGDNDAKKLLYKGFYIMSNTIKSYQKVPESMLTPDLLFQPDVLQSELLLCLSTSSCNLDQEKFTMIDTLSTPIWWRQHQKDIAHSVAENMLIRAYLYKIKQYFRSNREIIMSSSSDIAPTLLGPGWHPMTEKGIWSGRQAKILIPKVWKHKSKKYSLKLKFGVFDATIKKPKKVSFSIDSTTVLEKKVNKSNPMEYSIELPQKLLQKDNKMLNVIVTIPNASLSMESHRFKHPIKKGIFLLSIKLEEKNL